MHPKQVINKHFFTQVFKVHFCSKVNWHFYDHYKRVFILGQRNVNSGETAHNIETLIENMS